ncbi:L-lactate dehydrogenase [Sneathia sanguinegens]|uniref:L-lactate dehydrogenase n=1 Tax=Sneathia sanguinegens TaxID=40543 RepID=UPI00258A1618|nr:L-lactate dehydrogenase [Sneathia sanguinegens]MDU4652426.1 L-lactate dehydrogenase [Sneathia sanguinegens]
MKKTNKVSIIGAGFVGSATTLAIAESGLASHIVLVDINKNKAQGEALDIAHGAAFMKSVEITAGDYKDTTDSDIVVITAGAGQKPGESRLDLIGKNLNIFKQMIPQIVRYSPNSILLVVANPVDILTYFTYKLSGFPATRVIGSGTVLDTSRLKYHLAKIFDIDAKSVHGFMIGEHGDSEFPVWSALSVGPLSIKEYCKLDNIELEELKKTVTHDVKNAAYEIIEKKGYTNYAIGLAVRRIVEAILRDEKSILTISTYNPISEVYYSVPNVVGRNGQIMKICPELNKEEREKLDESMKILKEVINKFEL